MPSNLDHPFAMMMRDRIDALGMSEWTQQSVADEMNTHLSSDVRPISRFTICDWTRGRYAPRGRYHQAVATALCLPVDAVTIRAAGILHPYPRLELGEDTVLGGEE